MIWRRLRIPAPTRRQRARLRRRLVRNARRIASTALLTAIALGALLASPTRPPRLPPVLVESPVRLAGALVQRITPEWPPTTEYVGAGKPVPVEITAYCLKGTTRRGRYVRAGIVAADPRYFPLGRYIEVYVGTEYLGRFLVDDTGRLIIGRRLDIWTAECNDARFFGRRQGTAVLAAREPPQARTSP